MIRRADMEACERMRAWLWSDGSEPSRDDLCTVHGRASATLDAQMIAADRDYWMAEWGRMRRAVSAANRGIARLQRRLAARSPERDEGTRR